MRDSVRREGGGVSSDAWPAVHSPQLTVTLYVRTCCCELNVWNWPVSTVLRLIKALRQRINAL